MRQGHAGETFGQVPRLAKEIKISGCERRMPERHKPEEFGRT